MTIQQAVLLVGGRGTRMWPLTATVPKGLIPVAGTPFLDLQIEQLASVGVSEVLLAVGRTQLDQWEAFADDRQGVELIVEDEPLDTAGPVRAALDRLDERFLVLNGDVILEADLAAYLGAVDPTAAATLALVEVEDTSAYGVVVVDDGGRVSRFVEKPPTAEAPARTVNAGMYVMNRAALEPYALGRLSFERVVFPDLVEAGSLGGVVISGEWLDIGTPPLYLDCSGALLRGASPLLDSPAAHLVDGTMGGETGGSWSWVATDAVVAPGSAISESVVLPGATIESGSVVDRAVIGWNARIGPDCVVIGESMVGAGAVIGAGNEVDGGMRIAPGAKIAAGAVTFSPPE